MAHIDGDSSNSAIDNLVFLCLEHHDEFDSRTSQSKGLTPGEVARYRSELYEHFSGWAQLATRGHLLNFLASQIGTSELAVAVVRVASGMYFYGPRHAVDVLTWAELKSSDSETVLNHQLVLDSCASWGLLTYEEEELEDPNGYRYTKLTVHHKPICARIAAEIEAQIKDKGEGNWGPVIIDSG